MITDPIFQAFLRKHALPEDYQAHAAKWFFPLAESLATRQRQIKWTLVIGINGSQGSGKSTLSALLSLLFRSTYGLRALDISIDDFYLTRARRHALAETVHPLLATRGVPGTHDLSLMNETMDRLMGPAGKCNVPRFDKAVDDRAPRAAWSQVDTPLDILIVEGWCLGAKPQATADLRPAVNELEQTADPEGQWRRYVNDQLAGPYQHMHARIDNWVMLKAPSFDCVYQWRLEQEQKLAHSRGPDADHVMSRSQLARFIQHYQRITEHTIDTLPPQVDHLFELGPNREIKEYRQPISGDPK